MPASAPCTGAETLLVSLYMQQMQRLTAMRRNNYPQDRSAASLLFEKSTPEICCGFPISRHDSFTGGTGTAVAAVSAGAPGRGCACGSASASSSSVAGTAGCATAASATAGTGAACASITLAASSGGGR